MLICSEHIITITTGNYKHVNPNKMRSTNLPTFYKRQKRQTLKCHG